MAVVSALYVYPIKACRGVRVTDWPVVERGFDADRRWMIVDDAGVFVTQREVPRLALVTTAFDGAALSVSAPGLAPLRLPRSHEVEATRRVRVWSDELFGCVHAEGSAWFSQYLGAPIELVYMPDAQHRPVNPARARAGDIVSFADGYPFLLISEASLADLNRRLAEPVPMERFRPNIVVSGTEPFAEDGFAQVRLGDISFRGVKRCDRCSVTTVDLETGKAGREPLRTLATFRLEDSRVWFGMNLIHDGPGVLRVGDPVAL
ncbi:MAG TPA: MOSC N-terminal beta barrel domain-containing protein [Polyangiaceae bacterium]|nr:MOSC N-terminal beta barrel domain-containing protein [Polyangiaceae bacterium]